MIKNVDFRTKKEKERAERNKGIRSEYLSLIKLPDATPNRTYTLLGKKYGMTASGIINVLGDLIKSNKHENI